MSTLLFEKYIKDTKVNIKDIKDVFFIFYLYYLLK